MSSDTSPPPRYRLDNPAGATGGTGASGRQVPRHQVTATPSWTTVIGTTLRLWVRRHVLHVPDNGRIGPARRVGLAALMVVGIVAAVAAIAIAALASAPAASNAGQHRVSGPRLTRAQEQARAAAAAEAAANATAAANWIAAEVSPQAVIACDAATCAAILAAGYGSGGQLVLQPGIRLPAAGAVIVATPAVRAQYRAQLSDAAPAVIAAFGAGAQAVQVRVVVPGGQAAYSQAASSAVAARRTAGLKLLANSRVHARAAARAALSAGLVDPRLLVVLGELAAHYPVYIGRFGDAGPFADSSVPYRQAQLVGLTNFRGRRQPSELAGVQKLLEHQPSGYRAALAASKLPGGKYGLRIQFPAPSPL